jgi:hypothetical protein
LLPRRREGRPPRPHRRGPRRGLTLCVAWIPYVGCTVCGMQGPQS